MKNKHLTDKQWAMLLGILNLDADGQQHLETCDECAGLVKELFFDLSSTLAKISKYDMKRRKRIVDILIPTKSVRRPISFLWYVLAFVAGSLMPYLISF
jgi:hypothetical protein